MNDEIVIAIASILTIGALAQWLGWRLRVPAIVFLLAAGLLVGPVGGLIDPDEIFGDQLFALVSLAVAVILFEGALGLGVKGIRDAGRTVWMLLSVGAVVTLVGTAVTAKLLFDVPAGLAWVLAAVLVVTGPTVVGPLVRAIGLHGRTARILEAEGTLIDPLGAILAVLMFETFFEEEATGAWPVELGLTIGIGILVGLLGAGLIVWLIGRYLVPEHLQNVVTLAVVLVAFAAADNFQAEAGLVAVTAMGVAVASTDRIDVHRMLEFNEVLRILFISGLFLLLGGRIAPETLTNLGWRNLAFLAVLVLAIRPASVFLATVGSGLRLQERAFVAATAPRGIVAAAVASVFSIQLTENDVAGSQVLVAATFTVIAGTVLLSGTLARPLASRLDLIDSGPQRVVILGSNALACELATTLAERDVPVTLLGKDFRSLSEARMKGLTTVVGSVLEQETWERVELDKAAAFVAMSTEQEVNAVATRHAIEVLGLRNVYQVVPDRPRRRPGKRVGSHPDGRAVFGGGATVAELESRMASGWEVVATPLTRAYGARDYFRSHPSAVVLAAVNHRGVRLRDAGQRLHLRAGDTLVCLRPNHGDGTEGPADAAAPPGGELDPEGGDAPSRPGDAGGKGASDSSRDHGPESA